MSCGGNRRENRNAAVIADAVRATGGQVTVEDGRALFHRISDAERKALLSRFRQAHGRAPARAESLDLTQQAHAAARQQVAGEIAAAADALDRAEPWADALADEAAAWAGVHPAPAAVLPPPEAAAAVRDRCRAQVLGEFLDRSLNRPARPQSPAADGAAWRGEPGDGVRYLADHVREMERGAGQDRDDDAGLAHFLDVIAARARRQRRVPETTGEIGKDRLFDFMQGL